MKTKQTPTYSLIAAGEDTFETLKRSKGCMDQYRSLGMEVIDVEMTDPRSKVTRTVSVYKQPNFKYNFEAE